MLVHAVYLSAYEAVLSTYGRYNKLTFTLPYHSVQYEITSDYDHIKHTPRIN